MYLLLILCIARIFAIPFFRFHAYESKIIETYSLVELQEIIKDIKNDFFLLGKKYLLEKANFYRQSIVNDSLFKSRINLDAILEGGRNLAGETTSEEDESDLEF